MKTRFFLCFIVLVTVSSLTFTFIPLDIYASSNKNHVDQNSDDSPFSLPFDSAFADDDGDDDGGDDMDVDDLPFP